MDTAQLVATFSSSSKPRPEQTAEATIWHQRLGHLNAAALEQLVQQTTGAKIRGPIQVECEGCSLAKATRVVSRRKPLTTAPRPFWRIYVDIFNMTTSYNGRKAALLIKDEFTGMIFIYLLSDQTQATILEALQAFEAYIQRQFQLGICIIHRDNDRALQGDYISWIDCVRIQDEPTAPYTSAQNGPAERSGGVIGTKSRTMQLGANLPADLWTET
jgi:transposase InsO family protein